MPEKCRQPREALERIALLARFYADSSNAMERMGK